MPSRRYSTNVLHEEQETIPLKTSKNCHDLELRKDELKKKARILKFTVVLASIISIVLNLIMAVAALIIAGMRDSAATYAFGADCLLDLISSGILLWRFVGHEDAEAIQKERKACIFLGSLFVISAIAVICKAAVDIEQQDTPVTFYALYVLAVLGSVTCMLMAFAKIILSRKVKSDSLMLDALNSVISGALAMVIIVSDCVYDANKDVWYLEPMMSIILSTFLIVYGLKVIFDNRKNPETISTPIL